jgi:hypothetical protein
MGAFAQSQRPVAVPIVGSPAAQQPPQVPAQPPVAIPPAVQNQPASPSMPTVSPAMPAARGERKLELSFKDGTIALDAQNVTIRDILVEWQRRNGCQFVNADKLPPSPVTIQFPAGTPELDAIDSLLRGLGTPTSGYGYIVAPGTGQNASVCGAVYIVPSSRPTSAAAYAAPVSAPVAAPLMTGSPDTEIPPVVPFMPPGQPQAPAAVPPNQQPAQQNGGRGSNTAPPPQSPGFAPIAPTAPGASRFGAPPPATPTNGRGGD